MNSRKAVCLSRSYPESRFGGFSDCDGTVKFYSRVNALLKPESVVLDAGCGRGKFASDPIVFRRELQVLKGKAKRVIGIDPDPAAEANPYIDEFHLLDGQTWSVPDASVDLVVSDFVLEHVEDPDQYFSEIARVTKPGGHVCIRTPNSWGYVAICSKMIPNKHHVKVLEKAQNLGGQDSHREDMDVFPTVYKCNTRGKILGQFRKQGFTSHVYGTDAEPSYLVFSPTVYQLGKWYHKMCPGFMKNVLFAFAEKA